MFAGLMPSMALAKRELQSSPVASGPADAHITATAALRALRRSPYHRAGHRAADANLSYLVMAVCRWFFAGLEE